MRVVIVILRLKPGKRRTVLAILSAAGCGLIVWASGRNGTVWPLGMILAGALAWAVCARVIAQHQWKGAVRDALFWQFLLGGLLIVPFAYLLDGPLPSSVFNPTGLAYLAFIGPVASGLGFGLIAAVGRNLPAPLIVLCTTATPLIGYIGATLVLGEPVQTSILAGGGVMLLALVLNALPASSRL
jgi:O-acetylserine/cysteine efflux transporter